MMTPVWVNDSQTFYYEYFWKFL